MIQAGRVKLGKLHIANPAPCPPRHGDTITSRAIGIGSVEINFAGATGCQHHGPSLNQFDVTVLRVECVGPNTASKVVAREFFPNQIDSENILEH